MQDRINTANEKDLQLWAEKLGVDRHQLLDAIQHVGNKAEDVEHYLRAQAEPIKTPKSR